MARHGAQARRLLKRRASGRSFIVQRILSHVPMLAREARRGVQRSHCPLCREPIMRVARAAQRTTAHKARRRHIRDQEWSVFGVLHSQTPLLDRSV